MKALVFTAACVAVSGLSVGQIIPEEPIVLPSPPDEPWVQITLDTGFGRSQETWDIDSEYGTSDVLSPVAGFQTGVTAVTKRYSNYSAIVGLHHFRRGSDTDVAATIDQRENSMREDGINVTMYNAYGFYTRRTNWLELQLGARSWAGERFFVQGSCYAGLLLGGAFNANYQYQIRFPDPYTGAQETGTVIADSQGEIVPIQGVLTNERMAELYAEMGNEVLLRRKFNFGLSIEAGCLIRGNEVVISYRWSQSNLYPILDEVDFGDVGDGIFGSQQFLSVRFGYKLFPRFAESGERRS